MPDTEESAACLPSPVFPEGFNPKVRLPHGLTTEHIRLAMTEFVDFLGFINPQLNTRGIRRLETLLMPANFSSMVGEMMVASIPKYCPTLVKNDYHNGYPDLIPADRFPRNEAQHGTEGIEVKASRYGSGWQGHNAEDGWLMVFVFDSNRPVDEARNVKPRPFAFVRVIAERLVPDEWRFSGRSETSRRTITASVTRGGSDRMLVNWVYQDPQLRSVATEPET